MICVLVRGGHFKRAHKRLVWCQKDASYDVSGLK